MLPIQDSEGGSTCNLPNRSAPSKFARSKRPGWGGAYPRSPNASNHSHRRSTARRISGNTSCRRLCERPAAPQKRYPETTPMLDRPQSGCYNLMFRFATVERPTSTLAKAGTLLDHRFRQRQWQRMTDHSHNCTPDKDRSFVHVEYRAPSSFCA